MTHIRDNIYYKRSLTRNNNLTTFNMKQYLKVNIIKYEIFKIRNITFKTTLIQKKNLTRKTFNYKAQLIENITTT